MQYHKAEAEFRKRFEVGKRHGNLVVRSPETTSWVFNVAPHIKRFLKEHLTGTFQTHEYCADLVEAFRDWLLIDAKELDQSTVVHKDVPGRPAKGEVA